MLERDLLPNGVRIVTERIDSVQSASIGLWVGVGARDETTEIRGISHVIEHMLFKGTQRRSAQQIADDMDRIGGYLNAFTDKEYTSYYAKVLCEYIPECLDILADMFLESVIDDGELAREKNVIIEEIKRHEDQPDDLVHELFYEALWPGHDLGQPVIGTRETVSALTRDDILSYIRRRYTPDTIVVAAAGNLDHRQIVDFVAERFGGLTGSQTEWRDAPTPPVPVVAEKQVSKPVEQIQIVLGVPAYSVFDERKYPLSLLDIILGGGMSSRLFQEIREKRGLAYSVGSYAASYKEGGLFALYAGTSPKTAEQVVDISRTECVRIIEEAPSEDELLRAKNQVRAGLLMGQESMSNRMSRLGKDEILFDRIIPLEEIMDKILAASTTDVQAIAADILHLENFTMAQVGPFDEADRLAAEVGDEEEEADEPE
ncbi:MAG: pitrilysin family protein [Capsulimonadaceae bacterium]|nr:pitrilysin family protein [Capsulimonadaceae bacterium]